MLCQLPATFLREIPKYSNTANQIIPRRQSSVQGILVHPTMPNLQSIDNSEDFSRVNKNRVEYAIEETAEPLENNVQEENAPSFISDSTPRHDNNSTEPLRVDIPITYRRPNSGSINSPAVVEIPNNILSSPSTLASRPPECNRPHRSRPPPNRNGSQAHPNYLRAGSGILERMEL